MTRTRGREPHVGHHIPVTYDIDPTNLVTLTWSPLDSGEGRLTVRAASEGWAGESRAWFDAARVTEFTASLVEFPLTKTVILASGFGTDNQHLDQEHVRIDVYTVGGLGQVALGVHLATEEWADSRLEARHEVRLELLTTYERLRVFAAGIDALLAGQINEASIGGERLI